MSLKFCKNCGTLYDDSLECPKCREDQLMRDGIAELSTKQDMDEETLKKARRKSWLQLIIGVPTFIGFIYLVVYLFKLAI